MLLTLFGGMIAVAAPTDGQTAAVVFPAWGLAVVLFFVTGIQMDKRSEWKLFVKLFALGLVLVGIAVSSMVLSEQRADQIYSRTKSGDSK